MNEQDIIVKLTEHEGKLERHEGRIKNLENNYSALNDLAKTTALLSQKIDTMDGKIDGFSDTLDELTSKDGKRWDNLVSQVINLLIGAVIAYLLAKAGM
jgi:predicted nuclease with TOPRIM domain